MDTVLLKIKRTFTQDESINYLINELHKAKFEIGVKESEISELKFLNNALKIENKNISKKIKSVPLSKEDLKEERFTEMNKELTTLRKKIAKLNGDVDLWRSKWLNLMAKYNIEIEEK